MDKRTDVTLGRISGDLRSGDPFGGAISACYDRIFGIPSGITCAGNGILVPESPGTASGAAGEDSEVREDRGSALTTRIYSEVTISLMIEENMEQVDSRESGFALEVKNFLIGRVYLNISRFKKWYRYHKLIGKVKNYRIKKIVSLSSI